MGKYGREKLRINATDNNATDNDTDGDAFRHQLHACGYEYKIFIETRREVQFSGSRPIFSLEINPLDGCYLKHSATYREELHSLRSCRRM